MWFPSFELRYGGGTYAIIITESGAIDIRKIKAENGLLFFVDKLGIYQINKENRLIFGKSQVYIFDQKAINSLNIEALIDINKYLKEKKRSIMSNREVAFLVDSVKMKVTEARLLEDMEELGVKDDPKLKDYLDAKVVDAANREYKELLSKLDDETVRFLNRYYDVDTMAHQNVWLSIMESSAFKMKKSGKKYPFWPFQMTVATNHIALVIVDNRILDVDAGIKVNIELEGKNVIHYVTSKKYGKFKIADNKTIYRFAKTRVYILAVRTAPIIKPEQEAEPLEVTN